MKRLQTTTEFHRDSRRFLLVLVGAIVAAVACQAAACELVDWLLLR